MQDFAARIEAPTKKLVVIPNAGHATVVFRDVLLKLLNENVRALAVRVTKPRE